MMPFFFSNPAGFWALLAIPAIILIHLLQRQSIRIPASTLFLLDSLKRESISGRRLETFRNSLPFWLQILAALIFTWLLVEPRWKQEDSVLRIAVVADSSASMSAFVEEAVPALQNQLSPLLGNASTVELTLLESHRSGESLYHGSRMSDLLDTLRNWKPRNPAHDPRPALRIARSLADDDGVVIFLTDHETPPSTLGETLISVGKPIENVGFTGVLVESREEGPLWRAMVKNYSDRSVTRNWTITRENRQTPPKDITLGPGESRVLQGMFPSGQEAFSMQLEGDEFALDDSISVVLPAPKPLTVTQTGTKKLLPLFEKVLKTLDDTRPPSSGETADLSLLAYNPLSPTAVNGTGIVFIDQQEVPKEFLSGPVVSSNHPLVRGLNWQGLVARLSPGLPIGPDDVPLVWQGDRALIVLRETETESQLIWNFDIPSSNVERLPSFIVLVHRFAEQIRSAKVAPAAANFETGQEIDLAVRSGPDQPPIVLEGLDGTTTIPQREIPALRAPLEPGLFSIRQGDEVLLKGAAHFADTREADFSDASAYSSVAGTVEETIQTRSKTDPWWQFWMVGLLLISLFVWYLLARAPAGGRSTGLKPAT